MHSRTRNYLPARGTGLTALLALTLVLGCESGENTDSAEAAEADETGNGDGDGDNTEAEAEAEGTEAEAETGEVPDSDGDGLNDEEEAELGTDPNDVDTDDDNYWDSWEVTEGTDPLDVESRIYTGYWPYNPNKEELEQGSWATANQNQGTPFPRAEFLDHHGDMVDLYDFTNFPEAYGYDLPLAYFIFDLSAQWCGPCHNVANWIAGVDSPDTSWIQGLYPTVREKVHSLRIWWFTFVVESGAGGPPTASDATTWFSAHQDNSILILVDANQQMWPVYGSNAFPHFFLLDPEMKIEYFPGPADATDTNPYPAVGLVDTLLE